MQKFQFYYTSILYIFLISQKFFIDRSFYESVIVVCNLIYKKNFHIKNTTNPKILNINIQLKILFKKISDVYY